MTDQTQDENRLIAPRRERLHKQGQSFVKTGNTQAVLDGALDQFIEASLKSGL